jgi:hypothetical protein
VAVPNSVDKYDVKTEMEKSKQKKKYAIEHRGRTEERVTLKKGRRGTKLSQKYTITSGVSTIAFCAISTSTSLTPTSSSGSVKLKNKILLIRLDTTPCLNLLKVRTQGTPHAMVKFEIRG